jgi:hypothetical protein
MKTDWVAEVFAAMRDGGENISIVYGSQAAVPGARPRWIELQHDQYDGMSGLAKLLREQGLPIDAMPTLQGDRRSLGRSLQGLLAVLPSLKVRPRTWLRFEGARPVAFRPVNQRLAWKLFSEEETATIAASARDQGVTVNTFLLHHLDAAVARRLTPASSDRLWMVPVNLRGAVKRPNEAAPHMSFFGVQVQGDSSPSALQAQIRRLKQQGYHWGSWIALHAGRLIGAKGLRDDLVKREKQGHGWTGIFSNLGAWNVPGSGSWIFGPAISRVHPVGGGCVTMNGRMALTLQLHDAFGGDLALTQALLDDWTLAILPTARPAQAVHSSHSATLEQVASYG